jgi:hypothetical protein
MTNPPVYPDFSQYPPNEILWRMAVFGGAVLACSKEFREGNPDDRKRLEWAVRALHNPQGMCVPCLIAAGYLVGAHTALPNTLAKMGLNRVPLMNVQKKTKRDRRDEEIDRVLKHYNYPTGKGPYADAGTILGPLNRRLIERGFKGFKNQKTLGKHLKDRYRRLSPFSDGWQFLWSPFSDG